MLLHIVARGRIGRGAEAELVDRYLARIAWPTRVSELPDSGGTAPKQSTPMRTITLDEGGEPLDSRGFAARLEKWRDGGVREARFLIGAADGLTVDERAQADWTLSFGRLTWPHLMVRAMLAEQLFRATSILANHPYHRDG